MRTGADIKEGRESRTRGCEMRCPKCHGDGVRLGSLGRLVWYRCRACGWTFPGARKESSDAKVSVSMRARVGARRSSVPRSVQSGE